MSDYDSSLPIRTEADADERVQVKIIDATTLTQFMAVDSDGNAHVEAHGDNPAGGDEILRLSELGAPNPDGVYDGTDNSKPGHVGIIGVTRAATPADSDQVIRVTAKKGTTDTTVQAMDVSLHDEDGNSFSTGNPLPVEVVAASGTPVVDYHTTATAAKHTPYNHDYTIASTKKFSPKKIYASGSGKIKVEVRQGDGASPEVFTTKFVGFNSTAQPQVEFDLDGVNQEIVGTTNTTTYRLVITNLDNAVQDIYSTVVGLLI